MKKPSEKLQIVPHGAQPVTLATLEAMPATPHQRRGLNEMTLAELESADRGLRALPERLEKMSGICAVLNGLILAEIKGRLEHKQWSPWLEKNYGKSARTARLYMQIGKAFSQNGTGCRFEPQQLTLALLDDTRSGELDLAHPVVTAVEKWAAGRSYKQLIEDETGDGRATNSPGFRPNALYLRAWLEQEYPEHPEYLENANCFSALPEEIQKRYKAEGKRYEERLTKEQKEELETQEAARNWNSGTPSTLNEALDRGLFDRGTDAQLKEWEKALADALQAVKKQLSQRTTKKRG